MTKEKLKAFILLGSLSTVIGLVLLFFSVHFGISLAESWLLSQGGADTSTYLIIMEGYINNFLAAGSILFGIGLATIIFTYYKMVDMDE